MQIQISWLLKKKPTDLDLHCLQRQDISRFSRTRILWSNIWNFLTVTKEKEKNHEFHPFYTKPQDSGRELWFHVCLSVHHMSVFLFADNNFSKYQWSFAKLGMCNDIVEIWFGIAIGQILSIFNSYLPETCPFFPFSTITSVNVDRFSPNWKGIMLAVHLLFLSSKNEELPF